MKRPKIYGFGDAYKFLGITSKNFLKFVHGGKIYCQRTSGGRIFFESDLIKLKNQRIIKAKTDKRIKLKK